MVIAIGNVGSTSLKTKVVDVGDDGCIRVLGTANLDRIKEAGESTFAHSIGDEALCRETLDIYGYEAGIRHILAWYVSAGVLSSPGDIQAMGFKTVMGQTNGANNLTPAILEEMRQYLFAAPVHNGPYLEAIEQFRAIIDVPMVGVFEPSFHHTVPRFRRYLGIPYGWHDTGVRRLGFHGASHRYLAAAAAKALGRADARVITVHLGGSSSLCAVRDGKSVDINQCFSPNSGVLQGSRCGDVDPTAVLFAMERLGLSIEQAQDALSNDAGLKGMAGIGSDDLRAILQAAEGGNARAAAAVDLYVDGVRKHIGGLATVLQGVDAVVFGGGIGEHSSEIRERCLAGLEFMGIVVDEEKNRACIGTQGVISANRSTVTVMVIPTNEEMVVAAFTRRVVELGRDLTHEEMVFTLP